MSLLRHLLFIFIIENTQSLVPCEIFDPDNFFLTLSDSVRLLQNTKEYSESQSTLNGPENLIKHVKNECQNKTYIFNSLTKYLLVKYLTVDIPKMLTDKAFNHLLFPTITDLHYAATNLSYISKIYNLDVNLLASGHFLGRCLGINLTGDDCMEMVQQLNYAEDNAKAMEWLDEAERRTFESEKSLLNQINKFKLHFEYEDHLKLMNTQFPEYCRGDLQPKQTKYQCFLDPNSNFFPIKVEVVSKAPYIMLYHDVLGPKRREVLINIAQGRLYRGPVALATGGRAETEHRVAKIATIDDVFHESIEYSAKMTNKVTGYTLSREMTVVKYEVGGKFDLHYDFALEYAYDIYSHLGPSFANGMIYLADTEYGGEIVFPVVPAIIKPRAGSMVVWRDTDEGGFNDFRTLHGACPVVLGEKWMTIRNFREKGQHGTCETQGQLDAQEQIKISRPEYNSQHAELELEGFKNSDQYYNFESHNDVFPKDIRY